MEIIQDFLNKDHRCRPGGNYDKLLITIHSTGNPYSTARGERNWLDNPTNTREASWHYVVDETEVIQAIPDNEEAWHCGDTNGNRLSLGIEICESGDRLKTLKNAAVFAAHAATNANQNSNRYRADSPPLPFPIPAGKHAF